MSIRKLVRNLRNNTVMIMPQKPNCTIYEHSHKKLRNYSIIVYKLHHDKELVNTEYTLFKGEWEWLTNMEVEPCSM